MTILVIAEHDNAALGRSTHATVGAAALIATFAGLDVHVLVAGHDAKAAAEAATRIAGVSKVIFVDVPLQVPDMAEVHAMTVERIARGYSWILAPATRNGSRLASSVAATLGVAWISDVTGILSAGTFERAAAVHRASKTQQSCDVINVITVKVDAFDAAASEGGGAMLEKMSAQKTRRSLDAPNDAMRRAKYGTGCIEERRSTRFSQGTTFKALSDKLETAIGASRAFHERLRLKRYSCVD
ncbi:electron transfer flavoprotein subunit alpha/FixB family protein [Paraburkholderia sp. HD33-4]|uniref:electron transfer flavoprotein subunit alpha/FixB family protein n=1 Tax=Paraburkholderia sp. HD33-4 TaxID=2883242 RepID=UPI001F40FC78|nr:electron transfer flavoprotein subunit alpha/FixB family protein [Paraburkholderia sp. HD33-4]